MYSIFYIYTYKYKKPSNALTLSRSHALTAHTSQDRIKQPDKLYSQAQTASHLYVGKNAQAA